MAPRLTYGRHFGPPLPSSRPAAVIILLFQKDGEWQIPMTVRPLHLRTHGGQVSLPGGGQDSDETSNEAAIRELNEELGCDPTSVEIIGKLSPIYVYNSNFFVNPWVGIAKQEIHIVPNADEVSDWFGVSVDRLCLDPEFGTKPIQRGALQFSAPTFETQHYPIWGATSMILSEFRCVILKSLNKSLEASLRTPLSDS